MREKEIEEEHEEEEVEKEEQDIIIGEDSDALVNDDSDAITVRNLHKSFRLYHEKKSTVYVYNFLAQLFRFFH